MLIKPLPSCFIDQTAGGNKFYINLDPLFGTCYLFIRFRNILRVREFLRYNSLLFQKAIEPRNGAFVAALHEFYPENNQTDMGISPAHIPDQLDFFGSMLVCMGMRASGTTPEEIPGAVIAVLPAINILAVGFIFSGSIGNAITVCVVNK